jgi:lipoate-protein ligase A
MKNLKWRLIDTPADRGSFNMAFDNALLDSFSPEVDLPILRIYGWNPPAISLGRFQNAEEVLCISECIRCGIETVQRITGGGAIYHTNEITYSLVCPDKGFSSVKESYRSLCRFLIIFYKKIGLTASFASETACSVRPRKGSGFCFAQREPYDIVIDGKKIGGNAQKRKRGIVFQHGSIPLTLDVSRADRFFRHDILTCSHDTAGLSHFGINTAINRLKELLKESFMESLDISFIDDTATGYPYALQTSVSL